ncbi:MAG: hypothetical protein LQ340_001636 [Diploschistes diacapsis]|nr:MAG: hypothetical protein LQ340_001636 [Diploschistes diacapsis]
MAKWHNPFAFTPLPVTIISTLVYCAVLVSLLVVHHVVPSAPENPVPVAGINVSEAWLDLKFLSTGYHSYNSRRNDVVRNWLLQRVEEILIENNSSFATYDGGFDKASVHPDSNVVIYNDLNSNLSFSSDLFGSAGSSKYFEGTNVIVYIRGSGDGDKDWHLSRDSKDQGGVLVNAHYDSVSTGYGATDDGVGVVSVLQLIKYFTHAGNQPKRGIVALLNNGEEEGLFGAYAFARHPISSFPHTFVNLDGAGAGGKATLFRATDTEVVRFYGSTQYPYGSVFSSDGFKRGIIRSDTDYTVFNHRLGMRGLDIDFFEPRARYHTDQDDAKHTTVDSLWHMLSAALHSTRGLGMDTSSTFQGEASGKGKVNSGAGSDGVYFDMFGRSMAVFELHTLFALSVTLLVVAPIALFVICGVLSHYDKFYMFSISTQYHHAAGDRKVQLGGFRGFFRYPIIFAIASAGTVASAFLLVKKNPFIIYSSPYSVWSMMMSAWFCLAWFLSKAIGFVRPSAFHRSFAIFWMFLGGWVVLVIATIGEEQMHVASGYLLALYFAAIALAALIAFCEQFALEKKQSYAAEHDHDAQDRDRPLNRSASAGGDGDEEGAWAGEATESTSLLGQQRRTTFANYAPSGHAEAQNAETAVDEGEEAKHGLVYGHEQKWSQSQPSWTWILQLLILVPIPVILVGEVGLEAATGINQTLADGNPALVVYLLVAAFSILVIAPLGPFIHRYTYHVPLFLFGVLVGTLIYNIVAFPFSGNNRLGVKFMQHLDLDSGLNRVALTAAKNPYMEEIIHTLPSAAGKELNIGWNGRPGLLEYSWEGIPPNVVPNTKPDVPPLIGYGEWVDFNATRCPDSMKARIVVSGKRTRACRIAFNTPISNFYVEGSATDSRFPVVGDNGSWEISLWSREWEKPWNVTFEWGASKGMDGRVICLWNDEDGLGLIPALEEIRRFAPDWVAVTKLGSGLVEGSKAFSV